MLLLSSSSSEPMSIDSGEIEFARQPSALPTAKIGAFQKVSHVPLISRNSFHNTALAPFSPTI